MDSFLDVVAVIGFVLLISYSLRNFAKRSEDRFDNFQERLSSELEESRRQMRIEIRKAVNTIEHELKKLNDKN